MVNRTDILKNLINGIYADTDSIKVNDEITPEMLKETEDSTKSPQEVERRKQRFYIDTVASVMHFRYKIMDCTFDAFSKNCFYICDLKDLDLISDKDAEYLECKNIEFFHISNLIKKRGEKD